MTPLLPAFTGAPEVNKVYNTDALTLLRAMATGSADAVISDPPYPEIGRDYGRLTEDEWTALMHSVVIETRRILKPQGSAMFVLQPNSLTPGSMRLWLWKFMVWCGETWNIVQDAYWWNHSSIPTIHASQYGLMRGSVKYCVWLGAKGCYRNQDAALWTPSQAMLAENIEDRALKYMPSGGSLRTGRFAETVQRRGGVTPFNILPIANANSTDSAGSNGHGAGTPSQLFDWWMRYITPSGGLVVDPFMGSGTLGLVAQRLGRDFIGCDSDAGYVKIARERLQEPYTAALPMFETLPIEKEAI